MSLGTPSRFARRRHAHRQRRARRRCREREEQRVRDRLRRTCERRSRAPIAAPARTTTRRARRARRRRRGRTSRSWPSSASPDRATDGGDQDEDRRRREAHEPAMTTIESSLTPSKNRDDGVPGTPVVPAAAAPKMHTATISGSRSPPPCAAAANGFCGTMSRASVRAAEARASSCTRSSAGRLVARIDERAAIGDRKSDARRSRRARRRARSPRRRMSCRESTAASCRQPAKRAHVAQRRDADEHAADDERHDDHRDQSNEDRADRLDAR